MHSEGKLNPVEQPVESDNEPGNFVVVVGYIEPGAQIGWQDMIDLVDDARNGRHSLSRIKPAAGSDDADTHEKTDNQDVAQVAEFFRIKNRFGDDEVFFAAVAFVPQTDGVQFAV